MHNLRAVLVVASAASLAFASSAATRSSKADASDAWPVYINVRYGYQICYPVALLKPQREADNGDGRAFKAADGGELVVFGTNNTGGETLSQEALAQASYYTEKRGKVTYRAAQGNWIVLSGDNGKGIAFYNKTFRRDDQFLTLQLKYPKTLARRYRPVVDRLSRCFTIASRPGF